MPFVTDERFFKMSTSSSNFSLARVEAPPSAFHPSTSPRRYACVKGMVFDIKSNATSGNAASQSRLAKTASGTHGSVCAHPPGMTCGGSLEAADADGAGVVGRTSAVVLEDVVVGS